MNDGLSSSERKQSHAGTAMGVRLQASGFSDVGRRRTNNEDSFGYDLAQGVIIVCDGMGGMAAGEVASTIAVEEALEAYRRSCSAPMQLEERLLHAIAAANRAVWHFAQSRPELRGMGTTMVAACVQGDQIVVGNVGDSRAYFLRDGGCVQITEDHSYPNERTSGMAGLAGSPQFITRAVGAEADVQPDFFTAELQPGDTVLLATDGLTRYIDAYGLADHVQQARGLEEVCRSLVNAVYAKGADDNLTCVVARVI